MGQADTGNEPVRGLFRPRTPAGAGILAALAVAFLASGLVVVRHGEVGYGRLFGAVVWRDLQPGLHYLAPWPFAQADRWPVRVVKSVTSGAGERISHRRRQPHVDVAERAVPGQGPLHLLTIGSRIRSR